MKIEVEIKRGLVEKLNETVSKLLLKNQQYNQNLFSMHYAKWCTLSRYVEQSTSLLEEKHAAIHEANIHTQHQLNNLELEKV